MAFVFKSKRKLDYSNNDTLGPGYYESSNSKLIKPSTAPFSSSSMKFKYADNGNPGPGAYNDKNIISDKINTGKQNNDTLYKLFDYNKLVDNNSNLLKVLKDKTLPIGFSVKNPRNLTHITQNTPGPGQYNNVDLFNIQNRLVVTLNKKEKLDKSSNLNSLKEISTFNSQRPVSIPSKNKIFGYKVDTAGNIIANVKPEKNTTEEAQEIKSNWVTQYSVASVWAKSKIYRSKSSKKEQNEGSLKKEDLFGINKFDYTTTQKNFFNTTTGFKNVFKVKAQIKKPTKVKSLTKDLEYSPGPGYYNVNDNFANTTRGFNTIECFGSTTSRNQVFYNYEATPGPGAYFKDRVLNKNKREKKKKRTYSTNTNTHNNTNVSLVKEKLDAKLNTTSNFFSKTDANNSPGPGFYNTDSNWVKKFNKTQSIFGSSEKRFIESEQNKINFTKNSEYKFDKDKEAPIKKFNKLALAVLKHKKPKEIKDKYVPKFPCVGDYYPDKHLNIDFKIHKQVNKTTGVFAPFNSLSRKFPKVKTTNDNLGPGYYYSNTDFVAVNKDKHNTMSNFKKPVLPIVKNKNKSELGPGSYNLNSWFDWNKKTYNISYI